MYEDEEVYAFKDLNPQAPVHVLIIPKQHVADVAALEEKHDALAGKLLRVGAHIDRKSVV